MTKKTASNLQRGDRVMHNQHGVCSVLGYLSQFGPVLMPHSQLARGSAATPVLETSFERITLKL